MRKVVQCIPLKTMAALAVLEDIVNGAIGRKRVFRDTPGTVRRAVAGVGAEHRGQPIGTVPVDPELSHASRVGRNYLHLNQVYQIPTMQLNN